jgi:hypothetical protein
LLVAGVAAVAVAPAARAASPLANAASVFAGGTHLYVDPAAPVTLTDAQQSDVKRGIGGDNLYVALLPQSAAGEAGGAAAVPSVLGKRLGKAGTVLAFVGTEVHAAANTTEVTTPQAEQFAQAAAAAHPGDPVGVVRAYSTSFNRAVAAAHPASPSSAASRAASPEPQIAQAGHPGGFGVFAILVIIVLVGLGGWAFVTRRRRAQKRLEQDRFDAARGETESLYQRLGSDVRTLVPGDDKVAAQALADASERFNAAGSLLVNSKTVNDLRAVRRTAIEGLTAARVVRERQGLDPGPDLPPIDPAASGPQLQAPQDVEVSGSTYRGRPGYEPGAPYYFGGGYYGNGWVPGGWYSTPFWEPLLIGAALGGAFGGGFGGYGYGGGYGQGYEQGYDRGVEQGEDQGGGSQGGGGDWGGGDDWGGGGGGGGDWGGGGGDWGGGGGGDDWGGGGGGDWGGN